MPYTMGYQLTLSTKMSHVQERITSSKERFITSVQAIYVLVNDFTNLASINICTFLLL